MANVISTNVWVLDTAGTDLIWSGFVKIRAISWIGRTTAGHHATLTDAAGKIVFDSVAKAANEDITHTIRTWVNGLKLTVLGSGKVYVYIE